MGNLLNLTAMDSTFIANDTILVPHQAAGNCCAPAQALEITHCICTTLFLITALAMVLYFAWRIIALCMARRDARHDREYKDRDKQRQRLIDYQARYLNYLEKNNATDFCKVIDGYIKGQEGLQDNTSKKD